MTQTRTPKAQLDSSLVSASSTLGTGFVTATGSNIVTAQAVTIAYNFNQLVSVNGTIILSAYVPFVCTITGVRQIQANSGGACTANFEINTTSITGLGAISVTSTPQDVTATAANVVSAGNALNLIITSASSLTQLIFTLTATRTS